MATTSLRLSPLTIDEEDEDEPRGASGSSGSDVNSPGSRSLSAVQECTQHSASAARHRPRVSSWDFAPAILGGGHAGRRANPGAPGRLSAADRIRRRRTAGTAPLLSQPEVTSRWRYMRGVIALSVFMLAVMATGSVSYFFGLLKFTAIDVKLPPPSVDFLVASCIFLQFWTCLFLLVKYGVRLVWQHMAGSVAAGVGILAARDDGRGSFAPVHTKFSDCDEVEEGTRPNRRWSSGMASGQPSSETLGIGSGERGEADGTAMLPV